MINEFKNENAFLSNFQILGNPIKVGIIEFDSSEHFYQAHKTFNLVDRIWIAGLDTPGAAKKAGSRRGLNGRKIQLREDWVNDQTKKNVMYMGLILKFMGNYEIASGLLSTDNKTLVEGNWWHDNFWGNCTCYKCVNIEGLNNLGILLMHLRTFLSSIGI